MSIEIIVFDVPQESVPSETEIQLWERDYYRLGLKLPEIEALKILSKYQPLQFVSSDIAEVALSQVTRYMLPQVAPFEKAAAVSKKGAPKELKMESKKYFITITIDHRMLIASGTKTKEILLYIDEGRSIQITGARFSFPGARPRLAEGFIAFTDDKQVYRTATRMMNAIRFYDCFTRQKIWQLPPRKKLFEQTEQTDRDKRTEQTDRDKHSAAEELDEVSRAFVDRFGMRPLQQGIFIQELINKGFYDQWRQVKFFGLKSTEAQDIFFRQEVIMNSELANRLEAIANRKKYMKASFRDIFAERRHGAPYIRLPEKDRAAIDRQIEQFYVQKVTEGYKLRMNLERAIRTDKNISEHYHKLTEYVGLKNEDDLIVRKELFKDYVCPHLLYFARLHLADYDSINEKVETMRAQLVGAFGQKDRIGTTFCHICDEVLEEASGMEHSVMSRVVLSAEGENDQLYQKIWEEVSTIFSRYVRFSKLYKIPLQKIVESVAKLVREEVGVRRSEFNKNRTMTPFNLEKLTNIYIYIYAFAIISHMIFVNPEMSLVSSSEAMMRKGGDGDSDYFESDSDSDYFEDDEYTGGDSGEKVKAAVEKSMAASGKERLQVIINDALALLRRLKQGEIGESQFMTIDKLKPAFLMAYRWVYSLNYTVASRESRDKFTWDAVDTPMLQYLELFGVDLGRTKQEIFAELENRSIYDTVKMPKGDGYSWRSLERLVTYIKDKLYRQVTSTTDQELLKTDREREAAYRRQKYGGVLATPYKWVDRRMTFGKSAAERCVCAKVKIVADQKEYVTEDVISMLQSGDVAALKKYYSAKKKIECTTCRNARHLDSSAEQHFYHHYQNACPKGDFHAFESGRCKKCGLVKMNKEYFKKYLSVYIADRKAIREQMQQYLDHMSRPVNLVEAPPEKAAIKDIHIQKASKEFGIHFNLLLNIGLFRGVKYENLERGNENPSIAVSEQHMAFRNNIIRGHLVELIRRYNIVKNSEQMASVPAFVEKIFDKLNVTNIASKMIPVPKILPKYSAIARSHTHRELGIFLLDSMCEFLLKVAAIPTFGHRLATYLLTSILQAERETTEYTLKGIKQVVENDLVNVETVMETEDLAEMEEDEENAEDAGGASDDENVFAQDAIDMETDDPEDDENLMKNYADL